LKWWGRWILYYSDLNDGSGLFFVDIRERSQSLDLNLNLAMMMMNSRKKKMSESMRVNLIEMVFGRMELKSEEGVDSRESSYSELREGGRQSEGGREEGRQGGAKVER